ncbi:hypothetical protein B0H65DRAFT_508581 [Neurospora tetraspora]|uniref:Uncharacterized protein n=1 Tax=Neurospora tetraspora TaxID=94610 RepID=A0AAE0JET3_9PEZI|nr:hypothetical protein B0H65DRAFT_508581 [Neurospora tetraspora]
MSGLRADSPIRWAVGNSGGVVAGNTRSYQNARKIKRVHDTYPGLSAIKSTIGIQPLPRHRELQTVVCLRNKLICMRTEISYPSRCSSLGMFRCRTASEFYCGSVDPSNLEDVQEQRLAEFSSNMPVVLTTNAQTALPTQARVVSATRSYGVPSPVPVAYHAGKSLKTLDPATTALLARRYCTVLRVFGRLAGFDVRFSLLTEQLLVKVGTVKWLQIEAIPLLCSDGLALLNPLLHRSPHRCHAETVLAPSSLCV